MLQVRACASFPSSSSIIVGFCILMMTAASRADYHMMAAGDFNGDGIDDLAIGLPHEDIGAVADAGAVSILYGTTNKPTATGNQLWTQNSSGIADACEAGDHFGMALAAGDFNGDGFADLAIGVPGESVGSVQGAGAVHILYGSASGLRATSSQFWNQNSSGILDSCEANDLFGSALIAGDFDGDGFADLAIGVPNENIGSTADAGGVNVLYGTASGLRSTSNQFWSQNSSGILDACEAGDFFGRSLASGDFNGDGFDDLAISAPEESVGSLVQAGAVNVIYGSAAGLRSTGNQLWTQNSSNILDVAEAGDQFASVTATGDFNNDGFDDLACGQRLEDVGSTHGGGGVNVIYGSANGLRYNGNQFWSQDSSGILDTAEDADYFGSSLAVGDFNGDHFDDLAIGALGENDTAGAVHVLYGSATRLRATSNQMFDQASAGIADDPEFGDFFGQGLVAGRFNSGNKWDLAIAIPGEDIGAVTNAGAVAILFGSSTGLTGSGSQFWTQDSAGILDSCETGDALGGDPLF
jgi:hypothetical protein